MYISIDLDRLVLLHKHPEVNIVCSLVVLEAPDATVCIMPVDNPALTYPLGDLELGMLYRNTTGVDTNHNGQALRALVDDLCDRLPVDDVALFELDRQIENRKTEHAVRYVKGSFLPGKPADLFARHVRAPNNPDAIAAQPAPQPVPGTSEAPNTAKLPQRAPAAAAPPSKGVRAIVWEVADQLWGKEGKPTSKSEVLALRKRMMEVLESDHNVKRTSSSNELGHWQKSRVHVQG